MVITIHDLHRTWIFSIPSGVVPARGQGAQMMKIEHGEASSSF